MSGKKLEGSATRPLMPKPAAPKPETSQNPNSIK